MTDATLSIGIKADVNGARVVKRSLDDVAAGADKATASLQRAEKQIQTLDRAAGLLRNVLVSLGAAFGVHKILQAADQYQTLNARIREATRLTGDYTQVQRQLVDLSIKTGSALEANVTLFQRLANSRNDLRATNDEMLRLSETVNKLAVVGGAGVQEIKNGTIQLSQALAGGIVRAEEFNSIVENMNPVAQAVARELGIGFGELRRRIVEGKMTSEEFFRAILKASKDADEAFARMPLSLARAMQNLKTSTQVYLGEVNEALGGTTRLAEIVQVLAENIDLVAKASLALAAAALPAIFVAARNAVIALGVALSANPLFALASAVSAAAAAMVLFQDEIMDTLDHVNIFGTTVGDIFRDIGFGAKSIFGGVASVVAGTFMGMIEMLEGLMGAAQVKIYQFYELYNKYMPGTPIDTSLILSKINIVQAQRSAKDNFKIGASRVDDSISEWLAKGITPEFGKGVGLNKPPEINPPLPPGGNSEALEKAQKALKGLFSETRTEAEALRIKMQEIEALRPFARTGNDIDAIERGLQNAQKELDKLAVKAEVDGPTGKAFAALADEINDGFKDAFKSAFTETDGGFKKFLEGMKATFKNFIAELAYMAIARPIIMPVIGALGGAMGLSSNAVGSVLGTSGSGGGGGLGGIGDLLGLGKNFLPNGLSGITNSINGFGANIGFGGFGPGMSSFTSATLTSVLGAAGLGFAGGGLLASLMGGNQLTGGIGGGLGAGIGMIAGGPLGALIGGGLGSVVGGLFGGSGEPRTTLGVQMAAGANGMLGVTAASSKGSSAATARAFGDKVAMALNALDELVGFEYKRTVGFQTNVGSKDPGTWMGKTKVSTKPSDLNAIVRNVLHSGQYIQGGDPQMMGIMQRALSNGASIEQVVADLTAAKEILALTAEAVDPLTAAMDGLNKQFTALIAKAAELGLPTDKLTEIYEKQKKVLADTIQAQKAGFSSLEEMTRTFKAFLDSQALGGNSSLSPMDKLNLAQGNYDTLLSKAQGGDLSVTKDLLNAANDLLTVGRGVYASSTSFAGLESFVRSGITQIARAAGVPGYASGTNSAAPGLAWVGEQGPELVRFRGGETVYNNGESSRMTQAMGRETVRQTEEIKGLREDNTAMRRQVERMSKELSRVANALVAGR